MSTVADSPVADASPFRDGQPDWDAITFEVECSRCGYNLRLLPQPRCPECGLTFEWTDVIEAARSHGGRLFEHRWRRQPVRAYLRTVWRALRPRAFWGDVSIHARVVTGPLWFLLLGAPLLFLAVLHGVAALGWLALDGAFPLQRGRTPAPLSVRQISANLHAVALLPRDFGAEYWFLVVAVAVALVAALALLCSLRQTLGRCRVRAAQVLRVTAYCAPAVCILSALLSLAAVALLPFIVVHGGSREASILLSLILAAISVGVLAVYLAVGLRRYLQLPQPWALGFISAGVACLFTFTAFSLLSIWVRGR